MFRGINSINMDAKGRVMMPVRYREELIEDSEGHLVITIDTEAPCLLIYPLPEWELIEHKIESLPSFNRAVRRIQRLLIGHAQEVDIDGNGRFLIPPVLREYADLSKQIMLVGQGKKFEVWSQAGWNTERALCLEERINGEGQLPEELQNLSL